MRINKDRLRIRVAYNPDSGIAFSLFTFKPGSEVRVFQVMNRPDKTPLLFVTIPPLVSSKVRIIVCAVKGL